jgi:hypothetical protein
MLFEASLVVCIKQLNFNYPLKLRFNIALMNRGKSRIDALTIYPINAERPNILSARIVSNFISGSGHRGSLPLNFRASCIVGLCSFYTPMISIRDGILRFSVVITTISFLVQLYVFTTKIKENYQLPYEIYKYTGLQTPGPSPALTDILNAQRNNIPRLSETSNYIADNTVNQHYEDQFLFGKVFTTDVNTFVLRAYQNIILVDVIDNGMITYSDKVLQVPWTRNDMVDVLYSKFLSEVLEFVLFFRVINDEQAQYKLYTKSFKTNKECSIAFPGTLPIDKFEIDYLGRIYYTRFNTLDTAMFKTRQFDFTSCALSDIEDVVYSAGRNPYSSLILPLTSRHKYGYVVYGETNRKSWKNTHQNAYLNFTLGVYKMVDKGKGRYSY